MPRTAIQAGSRYALWSRAFAFCAALKSFVSSRKVFNKQTARLLYTVVPWYHARDFRNIQEQEQEQVLLYRGLFDEVRF